MSESVSSLCVFCCLPVSPSENCRGGGDYLKEGFSDNFVIFCKQLFTGLNGEVGNNEVISKMAGALGKKEGGRIDVCGRCGEFVGEVVEVRVRVDGLEGKVRRLQREILMALKDLQKVLGEYHQQLGRMEEVVRESDGDALKAQLEPVQEDYHAVFLLREAIFNETSGLKMHRNDLSTKFAPARIFPPVEMEVKVEPNLEEYFTCDQEAFSISPLSCVGLEGNEEDSINETLTPRQVRARKRKLGGPTPKLIKAPKIKREGPSPTNGVKRQPRKKQKRLYPKIKKKKVPLDFKYAKQLLYCNLCPDLKVTSVYALEYHFLSHHETPEKSLKCDLCPAQFSCDQYHQIHLKFHQGKFKRLCDLCPVTTLLNLTDHPSHLKSHHGDHIPTFTCSNCSFICGLKKTYLRHILHHSDGANGGGHFSCDLCPQQFLQNWKLIRHLKDKHNEKIKEYPCGIADCPKTFINSTTLNAHRKTHGDGHLCKECYQGFPSGYQLLEHKRTAHNGGFGCPLCLQTFPHKSALDSHQIRNHGAPKFKCDLCSKEYTNRETFNVHKRSHSTGGFSCESCGKAFETEAAVRRHAVVHTAERSYTCEQCGMGFKRANNLKNHVKTHDAKRQRFPCELCQKTFSRPENLKVHLRIHRGERPYVCDLCGKDFNQSGAFNLHRRTVHQPVKSSE